MSSASAINLYDQCQTLNIPNLLDPDHYHITIMSSDNVGDNFECKQRFDQAVIATPLAYLCRKNEITNTNVLLLHLQCQPCVNRHNDLKTNCHMIHRFNDYIPHVTLSYNVSMDFDPTKLPVPTMELELNEEKAETQSAEKIKEWLEDKLNK
ncbi:unnamed protein product [Didymodactylos carnosus]|uniref:Anti-CBASS protein Acb1 n=1 Tax=Didymodactylos carnosus TaxID=1234261 RepID=A0A814M8V7_9BILA|nr:unnamed protein product [Didymodactylos carnosus]CAF1478730.1 unnamed protein product [Didymodactylos carnosus]CAF3841911.1 unnamed protein product [Didymodactylos carnosus]CAF4269527.1 unnamed protein product [Didymodactylos carnosus]